MLCNSILRRAAYESVMNAIEHGNQELIEKLQIKLQ